MNTFMMEEPSADEILNSCFWYAIRDQDNNVKKVMIDILKFCNFLYDKGFRRFDIEDDSIFVRIHNNWIIKPVTVTEMQDFVYDWIGSLPDEDLEDDDIHPNMIKAKLITNIPYYFNRQRLFYLRFREPVVFNRDTLKSKFVYYRNGYIEVTTKGIKFLPYDKLQGYIWDSQVLDRNYYEGRISKADNVTSKFLYYISNQDIERFNDLRIAIGYYLHDYTDYKLKALLLTDSTVGDSDANGRTGKTLFCRLVGHMVSRDPNDPTIKSYVELNGKNFDPSDLRKYSQCSKDTKLVVINDLKRYFDVDALYNDITEGMVVDKKNLHPFKIKPKIILTTNKTVKIEGRSSSDRFVEYEFSDYFNDERTPQTEFGHWFFREWDEDQWWHYDKTMLECIQLFLANGCKMNEPKVINLYERKFIEQTSEDFVYYVRNIWQPVTDNPYSQPEIMQEFLAMYPDHGKGRHPLTVRRFTQWVTYFVKYGSNFSEFNPKTDIIRKRNESPQYIFKNK